MKTKFLIAVLALSTTSVLANPSQQTQAPVAAPAPQPYMQPAYPQQNFHGLPQKIMNTIQKMYPGAFIIDIDWESYGYEIELSNRMEMHFDRNGNFLGQKWDD